jgi:hypothetical protein
MGERIFSTDSIADFHLTMARRIKRIRANVETGGKKGGAQALVITYKQLLPPQVGGFWPSIFGMCSGLT